MQCDVVPLTVPPGTKPVASGPHRINPLVQKNVDAASDYHFEAGLIQHPTLPLVVIPKKDGPVRTIGNNKRLNNLVDLNAPPLLGVGGIMD